VAQGRDRVQGRRRFILAKVGYAYRYAGESKGVDMTVFGKTSAILALAAMSIATIPAQAQWHGPRHRDHDHVDGGDVLLGALLAGGLFAILSSGKHKEPAPAPEPIGAVDDQAPPPAAIGPDTGSARARTDEEAAVDACVASAESEGRRYARVSKIDKVTIVDAVASDWIVRGTLALRDDYRAPVTDRRAFTCRVGEKGVEQVTIDGTAVAAK
jgi:hypothetical protein